MLEIKVIHSGPYGVNSLVVPFAEDSKDVFVVDPGANAACDDENVIFDYIKSNSLNLKAVFFTHGHFDHVSGLKTIRSQFPDVPVYIHEKDAPLIGKEGSAVQLNYLFFMGMDDENDLALEYKDLPEATELLKAGMSFNLLKQLSDIGGSGDWNVIHTPGHTPGCVCFYNEKEKILISGDTVFYHSWGRTDLPGGSEVQMRQSLTMLGTIIGSDVKVFPGHDRFGFSFGE